MKYTMLVSVIMPCYNTGQYIEFAIQSILDQSFSEFEFIIINDGSTDNTDEVIRRFSDPRIRYISMEENRGNYAARNTGLKAAAGKYVAVMDSDDMADENRLTKQFSWLEAHPETGCLGSFGEVITEKGESTGRIIKKPLGYELVRIHLLKDNYTLHPSLMFRKSLLDEHSLFYNESLKYAADYDFVTRCAELFPIDNIEDQLIKYRSHPQQISAAKFTEQQKVADTIRVRQLNQFEQNLSATEQEAYLALLKAKAVSKEVIETGVEVFNMILEKNDLIKKYDQDLLTSFLSELTAIAVRKYNHLAGTQTTNS